MKITAIVGSPRGVKGATGALMKIVLQGAESLGATTEIFAIKGQEIKPCKACNTCHRMGIVPSEGLIQNNQGEHRPSRWSPSRQPELYIPR